MGMGKEKCERLQTFLVNIGLIKKGQKIVENSHVDKNNERLLLIRVRGTVK